MKQLPFPKRISTWMTSGWLGAILLCGCLLFPTNAGAQFPNLLPEVSKADKPKVDTAAENEAKLRGWLTDARKKLARLEDPATESNLPAGISPAALSSQKRDLDQIIRSITRALTLIASLPDAEAALEAAKSANQSWAGFTEPPPYSLLMVDDLINRRDATREKEGTYRSSISLFQRSLESIQNEVRKLEDATRTLNEANAEKPDDATIKWKLDAAADESRLISVRIDTIVANIRLLEAQAAAALSENTLFDRQIKAAGRNAAISDTDIENLRATSKERMAAIKKQSTEIRTRLKTATANRTNLKEALDQLTAKEDPPATPDELSLASARLTTAEMRVDSLQSNSDNLEALGTLEMLVPDIYLKRKTYLESKSAKVREANLQDLRNGLDRLKAWELVSLNELSAVNADLTNQDSVSAPSDSDDPRVKAIAERRDILWEKQRILQKVVQAASYHRKNLERWVGDFDEASRPKTWKGWISTTAEKTWKGVQNVWDYKLFEIPTTEVGPDGVSKTTTQGIELGLIISAVIFFIIAYVISARFSRRLQKMMVGRGRIAEAQANTLRNWIMIFVGVVLALTTLHLLRIPLTVFAFFGGALAIGLGFGTQTLIKNFISGIIVLFERKIRVGDIVGVGTVTGKVLEINTRSSVLRSADGMETIVPNSLFLENQISNLTLSNRQSRRMMRIGVAYGTSPQSVSDTLKECCDRHGLLLKDPAPQVIFDDFADSALIFTIYYWLEFNDKTDPNVVASDLRFMICKRFAEVGISMPFPQRDVHLSASQPLQLEWSRPSTSKGTAIKA